LRNSLTNSKRTKTPVCTPGQNERNSKTFERYEHQLDQRRKKDGLDEDNHERKICRAGNRLPCIPEQGQSRNDKRDIAKGADFPEVPSPAFSKNESIRGPGGGFVLARHPSLISIWEIISSVEQNFSQIGCHRESKKVCNIIDGCKTQLMWEKLSEKMEDFLDSITVESLIKDAFYGRMEAAGEESIF
jgi:hypothetical protein